MQHHKLLTTQVVQYGIVASLVLILFQLFEKNKFMNLVIVGLCWILASNLIPIINAYLFFFICGLLVSAIYLHNVNSLIVALIFVANIAFNSAVFVSQMHNSPLSISENYESFEILSNKIRESKIKCSKEDFLSEVEVLSNKTKFNPSHILFVMWMESKINPGAINEKSNARGLIQFMPKTSKSLNIDHSSLTKMDAATQMKYVDRYFNTFQKYYGKCDNIYDLYLIVFYPKAIGKHDFIFPQYVIDDNKGVFTSGNDYEAFTKYVDRQMISAGIGI